MSHGDLAYSTEGLPAHTDTTYFTDPAGLQIFHLLSHPPPGTGGTTLLVDAFSTAALLETLHPTLYDVLSRLRIPCHASGTPGTLMRPPLSQPVLRHDENSRLVQVRWNNEDRGVLGQGWQAEDVGTWYRAARCFEEQIRAPDAEYRVQLSPGTMVGEHASTPFTDSSHRQLASDARPIRVHWLTADVRRSDGKA
ncbi:hypothetical protein EHS25_000475 [Saitozyma podzolica]|uniref:TauD/TfdA-like domain-containing protein n=1 Tax=Saitozyma podzolica TaxID=1890683 RepID=A0A427YW82_9TREE|nr:hypothetical protein EHS25_000475 [Saitozyma podzolica]